MKRKSIDKSRILLTFTTIATIVGGVALGVTAESPTTVQSKGRIEVSGDIIFDATDFDKLEEAIEVGRQNLVEDIKADPSAYGVETTQPLVINFGGSSVWKHPDGVAGGGGSLGLDTTNYSKMVVDNVSNGSVTGGSGQHAVGVSCSLGNPPAGRATTYDLTNVNSVSFRVSNWSGANYSGTSDVGASCRITLYP